MKIKRYVGRDIQDAILKVRMDLGSDAIILNTRKIRQKGIKGFFYKPVVEVLAAIDEGVSPARSQEVGLVAARNHNKKDDTGIHQDSDSAEIRELQKKVNDIEKLVEKIYQQTQNMYATNKYNGLQSNPADRTSRMMEIFYTNLIDNNVEPALVDELINEIKGTLSNNASMHEIAARMYASIASLLGKPQPIGMDNGSKAKVVIFVGPTGVGKTTTLAKLAAIYSIQYKKDIGIISTDTYRIAAVEQLKTYADILGLPLEIAYSPEEVKDAINKFKDKNYIFIDTAGKSHKDVQQLEELKRIIKISNPEEIFLLISLTTDNNVCKEIIDSYNFLKDYRIIFTKMDETISLGVIVNVLKYSKNKLSYITTGQSVPDDIEIADADKIIKKLLGSIQYERSGR
ncbi:MAG: flagellar biosynthesis protein FlhF [Clostridiaceae bacterium]|nr:flagellar biosynthesis protein FlhF [Clostridiaceae bacterium]